MDSCLRCGYGSGDDNGEKQVVEIVLPLPVAQEGPGVDRLRDVLNMLADARQKHDAAARALECTVTMLSKSSGMQTDSTGLGPHKPSILEPHKCFGPEPKTGSAACPMAKARPDEPLNNGVEALPSMKDHTLETKATMSIKNLASSVPMQGSYSKAATPRVLDMIKDNHNGASSWTVSAMSEIGICRWCSCVADYVLRLRRFEFFMGLCILVNSICIGIETQQALAGEVSPAIEALEHCFLVIYILELLVRLLARGARECFQDAWFIFDLILVVTGAFATWVMQPIQAAHGPSGNARLVSQLMVFRICRLLRMLRALRMMKQFRSIWRLVYGLLTSFNTMISTLSLVALVLYIFACLGVELITKDATLNDPQYPDINRIVDTYFRDLFVTLMFLFQFVTLDSVASVYMPLIKIKPILAIYFLMVLLVVSISLMNLVMAKIVEGALDAAHQDHDLEREQKKEKIRAMIPMITKLFEELDLDGSGMVELGELELGDTTRIPEDLQSLVEMDSMMELFDILDVDQSGEVSQEEFIEGMLQMHISEVPIQTMQILKMLRTLRDKVSVIECNFLQAPPTKSVWGKKGAYQGPMPAHTHSIRPEAEGHPKESWPDEGGKSVRKRMTLVKKMDSGNHYL